MPAPKKSKLPKPLPDGFILTDNTKKQWRLGKIFGKGGFGLIYLASRNIERPVPEDAEFVIKLEYLENGPLFCEQKFYQRAAKLDSVQSWVKSKKLDFLGVPRHWGFGQAQNNGLSYRFMAMDRLGTDLQKFYECSGRFKKDTVLQLGQKLVDVLEYIHENEYVHADIKASNLMLGFKSTQQVYLADYGLSQRYCPQGEHIPYKERPKDCHNGTIEYTSLDAHKGVSPSRRSDLEILGYCLLHWVCGSLPWMDVLNNPEKVHQEKVSLMKKLPTSVRKLAVGKGDTDEVADLLLYVRSLEYEGKPDYKRIRQMLATRGSGPLDFSALETSAGATTSKKPGRGRKATKAAPVDPDSEDDAPAPAPAPAPAARPKPAARKQPARSSVKPPVRDDSPDDETEERPRPILARYLRGPPLGNKATQKKEVVQRKRKARPDPETSEEEEKEEEEEEEEEERPMTRSGRSRRALGEPNRKKKV